MTLNYGLFVNAAVTFLIVSACVFIVVRLVARLQAPAITLAAAPTTKNCPFCATAIPIPAKRCPNCTSQL